MYVPENHLFFLTHWQAFLLQYFWLFTRELAGTILLQFTHLIVFMVLCYHKDKNASCLRYCKISSIWKENYGKGWIKLHLMKRIYL